MTAKLLQPAVLLLLVLLALAAGAAAQELQAAKPGQCSNQLKDGSETDIDCGGSECSRRCSLTQACSTGADCVSGTCDPTNKQCVCPAGLALDKETKTCYSEQSLCYNGKKDGQEVDVDCGGTCTRRCMLNQACYSNAHCQSSTCDLALKKCVCPAGQTQTPDRKGCRQGPLLPAVQKDVKPAGSQAAPACALNSSKCSIGEACRTATDCSSGVCNATTRRCSCPSGASITPNGTACTPGSSAATRQQQVRVEASKVMGPGDPCWNGIKDGAESDVDCGGGTCWKCPLGKSCRQASDCDSLTCNPTSKKCVCPPGLSVAPGGSLCIEVKKSVNAAAGDPCFNGKKDPQESDVDCGGNCTGCSFGHACKATTDCAAGTCNRDQGICMCPRGQFISPDSSTCLTKEELCFNGAKDAGESDVDCGGSCAAKCRFGQFCNSAADCATAVCNATTRMCSCPSTAPLSPDGAKCLTACDTATNPCKNGGTCLPNAGAVPNYKCSCPSGYNGTLCQMRVSTCEVSNPCRNGGKCIPTPGYVPGKGGPDFRCYCLAGYSGAMCEVAKSSCFAVSQMCRNGGTCIPLPGATPDFMCNCTSAWKGMTCTERAGPAAATGPVVVTGPTAATGPAATAGPTAAAGPAATAGPTAPAGGDVCQASKPCLNGGTCQAQPGGVPGFNCTCPDGFEGETCQTKVNTCDSGSPCENGECVPSPAGTDPDYTCQCVAGYSGDLCENQEAINTCDGSNPCKNGGECVPLDASYDSPDYRCNCTAGFTGLNCESPAVTTVTAGPVTGTPVTVTTGSSSTCDTGNPCRNGGTCTPKLGSTPDYTCTCTPGFSGPLCASKVSTCSVANPCINAGSCVALPGSSPDFKCSCSEGYIGTLCEVDCFAKAQVPDTTKTACVEAEELVSTPAIGTSSNSSSSSSGGNSSSSNTCGSSAGRKCVSGEPCQTGADCENSDCRVFPALDNLPRCTCPKGSFIFLVVGAQPQCVTQEAMCTNGVKDLYEGDVDCGFYCGKLCGLGQACKGSSGCASGYCNLVKQQCSCAPGFSPDPSGVTCIPLR